MKVNRELFWDKYKESFDDSVSQPTVDALNYILDRFEDDKRLKLISEYSYVLATAYHESGLPVKVRNKKVIQRFVPVKEGKGSVNSNVWIKYQSKYWNTGFYGRGFIQITHKENYLKIGEQLGVGDLFVRNPDLMLEIKWAYEALVLGMTLGLYRSDKKGKQKLSRYFTKDNADIDTYYEAREIVNGDKSKNGMTIAKYADKFESILLLTRITDIQPLIEEKKEEILANKEEIKEAKEDLTASSNSESTVSVFESLDGYSNKVDKLTEFSSKISKSSIFAFIWKQILAVSLFTVGFVQNNWEWIVLGLVVLLIAAYLWNEAKKRNSERQKETIKTVLTKV